MERNLQAPDILNVLETGYHEEGKDKWDETYQAWNYAIRGYTSDKDGLRVVVSFYDVNMLIITVIRIVKREGKNDAKKG